VSIYRIATVSKHMVPATSRFALGIEFWRGRNTGAERCGGPINGRRQDPDDAPMSAISRGCHA